jgi:hypothetical protein
MPRDFFDPTPEQQNVVLIDAATLQNAQRLIAGCEACSADAELPFDTILDRVTGVDCQRTRVSCWLFFYCSAVVQRVLKSG